MNKHKIEVVNIGKPMIEAMNESERDMFFSALFSRITELSKGGSYAVRKRESI